jgi:alcohol-forming fatty acyl-CoA reductase
MSSPEQIGAFFDLDGALLPSPSLEWRFVAWLAARDEIGGDDLARWLGHFARNIWHDPYAATFENKHYLCGLRESLAAEWESSLAADSLRFFSAGVERIAWHHAQGHRVFLVSGTLGPLARAAVRRLPGQIEVCASELDARDSRWTGRLAGEHLRGEAKARAVRRFAARYDLDVGESYAYGNCLADLPMLESVGRPVAVNPDVGLERIACAEVETSCGAAPHSRWKVCVWKACAAEISRRQHFVSAGDTR